MAGLAGGALVCWAPGLGAATADAMTLPPSRELPMVSAVQAALRDGEEEGGDPAWAGELALRPSPMLIPLPDSASAPRWQTRTDVPLMLRSLQELPPPSAAMSPSPGLPAAPVIVPLATEAREPTLRLSQMNLGTSRLDKAPRWMTSPDQPTRLRPARDLRMPGGAGLGRELPLPSGSFATASDDADEPGIAPLASSPSSISPRLPVGGGEASSTGAFGTGWEIPPIRWGGVSAMPCKEAAAVMAALRRNRR